MLITGLTICWLGSHDRRKDRNCVVLHVSGLISRHLTLPPLLIRGLTRERTGAIKCKAPVQGLMLSWVCYGSLASRQSVWHSHKEHS